MGSYRNTWAAIGVLGNSESGKPYLGSHRNTWAAIGIPGNWEAEGTYWAAIGTLENL